MLQPAIHPSIPLFTHPPLHPPFNPINKDGEGQLGPLDTPGTDLLPLHPHDCFCWPPPRSGNVLAFRQLLESPVALIWVMQNAREHVCG